MSSKTKVTFGLRKQLKRLAQQSTKQAENYLVSRYTRARSHDEIIALLDSLRELGTRECRNAVIDQLVWHARHADLLLPALQTLEAIPIENKGPQLLQFLDKKWPIEVRCSAARILATCTAQHVLDCLAAFAHLTERNVQMRIATLRALGRAGYLGLLHMIQQEGPRVREVPNEQTVVWDYLKQLAEGSANSPCPQYALDIIESIVDDHMETGQPFSQEMIAVAGAIPNSRNLQSRLAYLAFDDSSASPIRAAAISALNLRRGDPMLTRLRHLLNQSLGRPHISPIAGACAEKLALIIPEELLDITHPLVDAALWKMSLKTGRLVFADRIVDPAGSPLETQRGKADVPAHSMGRRVQQRDEDATDGNSAQRSSKTSPGRLRIGRWGELGIGVAADRTCLAFVPCPAFGQQVTLAEGVPLDLPKGQWESILDCLIKSPDGRTVANEELYTALKLNLKSDKSTKSAKHHQGLRQVTDVLRRKLQRAMANLAKQFRKRVCADKRLPVFESDGDSYRAAFVARCLLRDEQRHYRFGDPR